MKQVHALNGALLEDYPTGQLRGVLLSDLIFSKLYRECILWRICRIALETRPACCTERGATLTMGDPAGPVSSQLAASWECVIRNSAHAGPLALQAGGPPPASSAQHQHNERAGHGGQGELYRLSL